MTKLDENFSVTSDSNGFTLKYEKLTEKDGKQIKSSDSWHYSNMKMILKTYVNESLKPCNSVLELHEKLNYLYEKIDSLK